MSSSLVSDDLIPISVAVDDAMIRVEFNGGLQIATPVRRFPRLVNATPSQRDHWRLIGRGDGIHWPDVDEDISVRTLLSQPRRKAMHRMEEVPSLIGSLLKTTERLNSLFAGRPFTPDGQMVGSIGVVIAEHIYGLKPLPVRTGQVAARTVAGQGVQIKLTGEGGTSFAFRWPLRDGTEMPDLLIAMKLTALGFEEIYNGPYPVQELENRPRATNGQLSIALSRLRAENPSSLKPINSFQSVNVWFSAELRDIA